MSIIRNLIDENHKQMEYGVNSVENSTLITTEKTEIISNRIALPSRSVGDIVWNMSVIFQSQESNVIIAEATCKISSDGMYAEFDSADNLGGNYGIVTYLGQINE